jgi:hypothetical protein
MFSIVNWLTYLGHDWSVFFLKFLAQFFTISTRVSILWNIHPWSINLNGNVLRPCVSVLIQVWSEPSPITACSMISAWRGYVTSLYRSWCTPYKISLNSRFYPHANSSDLAFLLPACITWALTITSCEWLFRFFSYLCSVSRFGLH